jgi:hypothetical protein
MELLADVGHVKSHLFLFGDRLVSMQDWGTVCAKHTISSENILDAPDGTPRWWGSRENSFLSVWGANLDAR